MKTLLNRFTTSTLTLLKARPLAGLIVAGVLCSASSAFAGNGTPDYVDFNNTTLGFGTAANVNDTDVSWNTDSTGAAGGTFSAFTANDQMTFGFASSDLANSTFTVNNGGGEVINGFFLNSTNTSVTLAGSGNVHFSSSSMVVYVTNKSTLVWNSTRSNAGNVGFNMNNETLSFIGIGTNTFITHMGCNSTGLITLNGPTLNLAYTASQTSQPSDPMSGGFTLTSGTLNFQTAASADAFYEFNSSTPARFALNGGAVDNTSGSPMTLVSTNTGGYSLGGNFTFVGSSSLSLGTNVVVLTGTRTVTVNANTLTMAGVISGSGFGLTKSGPGTLTLTGANTYTGVTTDNQGTLITTTASTGGGGYVVADGATMSVQVAAAGQTLAMSSLKLGTSTGCTLQINTGSLGDPSAAVVNAGALTINAPVAVTLAGTALTSGTFTILTYSSKTGSGSFALAASPHLNATLHDDNAGHVTITFNSLDTGIVWRGGAAGLWDTNDSANTDWVGNVSGSPTFYLESSIYGNDPVRFDDTATGTTTVALSNILSPASIIVSNTVSLATASYTFTNSATAGKISGTGGLTKQGSGTLKLVETGGDNFSGGVTVSGGTLVLDNANSAITGGSTIASGATLQVGNADANGALPGGNVADSGTLIFNQTVDGAVTAVISGTGAVIKTNSDVVTLKANSTFSGGATINGGTLQVTGSGGNTALGAGNTTVNAGTTLIGTNADAFGYAGSGHSNPTNIFVNGGTVTDLAAPSYRITSPNFTFTGGTLTSASGNAGDVAGGNYSFNGNGVAATITTIGTTTTALINAGIISPQAPTTFNIASGSVTGGATPGVDMLVSSVIQTYNNVPKSIIKSGSGVLALTGTSTYAGGTLISGGTLQLGTSADAAPLTSPLGTGLVTNNATLNFASSQSVEVDPVISGSGTLVMSSGGGILTAANTYTGNTTINGGILSLSTAGSIASSAHITVGSSGTFDVSEQGGAYTLNAGQTLQGSGVVTGLVNVAAASAINLGATVLSCSNDVVFNGGSTNFYVLSTSTSGANGRLVIAGNLTLNGTTTISINYTALQAGRYKLITYGGSESGSALADLTLAGFAASGTRQTAVLDDSIPGEIDLLVSGVAGNLTWAGDGVNNNWDNTQTSQDWTNKNTLALDYFYNGDIVTFDDTGSKSPAVNLVNAGMQPSTVLVTNNTGTYTFSGSGNLAGNFALTKQGAGTLVLTEAGDTYAGGIAVGNGKVVVDDDSSGVTGGSTISSGATLQLGNNDTSGVLPSGSVTMNGTLNLARNDSGTVTVPNTIGGASSGTLTVNPGNNFTVVNLGAANTFTGAVTVASGTLQVGNAAALGTTNGVTTVNSGASLDVNHLNLGQEPLFVSGIGTTNLDGSTNGAIYNSGASVFPAVQRVTLLGDTVFGASENNSAARWDLRSSTTGDSSGASLSTGGHAYNLTKVGLNHIGIVGATVDPALGNIDVQAGILSIESATTGVGDPAHTLTVEYGADLSIYQTTNLFNKNFVFNGYGITNVGTGLLGTFNNTSGNNNMNGPMTLNGDVEVTFRTDAGTANQAGSLTLNGVIAGPGALGKNDTNTLALTATNTYTGNTLVNGGILALRSRGSIAASTQVIVGAATLDATALSVPLVITNSLVVNNGALILSNTPATGINNLALTNAFLVLSVTNPSGVNMTVTNLAIDDPTIDPLATNLITITTLPTPLLQVQYTLIKYKTLTAVGAFDIGVSNLPPGCTGYISNNVANSSIDLVLTTLPYELWSGGSASDSYWSDAANWNNIAIAPNAPLLFAGTSRLNNTNDTAAETTYSNIVFIAGAGPFNLNGDDITLIGNITNLSANLQTDNISMSIAENPIINAGTAGLVLNGGITNTSATLFTVHLQGTNGTLGGPLASAVNVPANLGVTVDNTAGSSNTWSIVGNNTSALTNLTVAVGGVTFGTGLDSPSLSITNSSANALALGSVAGLVGAFNMNSGTLNVNNPVNPSIDLATGNNGSIGMFNMNGGTLNVSGKYFMIGDAGGTGIFNQNGGTVNVVLANNLILGNSINNSGGTVNISGGTFTCINAFSVGFRGIGIWNISGNGAVVAGTVNMTRNSSDSANASGTVNLNGGSLTMSAETMGNAGTGQTGAFNFNGGILHASAASTTFLSPASSPSVFTTTVRAGGAIIDDGGHAITVSSPLLHDAGGPAVDGGLLKFGSGTLTLGGANTYTGPTVVSNGTLAVNGSIGVSAVTVLTGATLSGTGSLGSNVTVNAGGTIAPAGAATIGTLTVSSNLVLQGTASMEINVDLASNDRVNSGTVTYGGTLSVANLSGTPVSGNSFKLFNASTYAGTFTATNLPALASGLGWSWTPANGTLSVVQTVSTSPTSITATAANGVLTLMWPADHTGWRLLVQTNNLALGISDNTNDWMTVPGSTGINQTNITINPALPTEFYELVYP